MKKYNIRTYDNLHKDCVICTIEADELIIKGNIAILVKKEETAVSTINIPVGSFSLDQVLVQEVIEEETKKEVLKDTMVDIERSAESIEPDIGDTTIASLEDRMADIKRSTESIKSDIEYNNHRIDDIEYNGHRIDDIERRIDDLEINTGEEDLRDQFESLESLLVDLEDKVYSLESLLVDLEDKVYSLESQIHELSGKSKELQPGIDKKK